MLDTQLNVLSVAPFSVIPPPFAVVSVGVVTEPNSMLISSTVIVVALIVVVVPLTVKSPPTVTFPDVVNEVNVPTLVNEDEVTPEARVEPVNVSAAAGTVPDEPSAIDVPFIVTDEFSSLSFEIDPASIALVTAVFAIVDVIETSADPLNETDPVTFPVSEIVLAVCRVDAVLAFPVRAPVNEVDVTDVRPVIVVALDPSEIAVLPTVTPEFAN